MIPLWAIKLGISAAAALALFSAGAYAHMRWADAKAAKAALQASEQARKVEHDNAVSMVRKMDSYSVTMAQEAARAVVARSDTQRVRDAIPSIAAAASAAACSADDRSARAVELFGESLELLEEGRRHVERLKAQRDALR